VDVDIDTVIVDEAGCVAEMALPTLINLAPSNLVLVGDHLQLPAYTDCVDPPPNHIRR
jgi:superfamily I DNA and/or RNA helicase